MCSRASAALERGTGGGTTSPQRRKERKESQRFLVVSRERRGERRKRHRSGSANSARIKRESRSSAAAALRRRASEGAPLNAAPCLAGRCDARCIPLLGGNLGTSLIPNENPLRVFASLRLCGKSPRYPGGEARPLRRLRSSLAPSVAMRRVARSSLRAHPKLDRRADSRVFFRDGKTDAKSAPIKFASRY
jgi:hypothetical protein